VAGVSIDILDPAGAVVNSYRSTGTAAAAGRGRGGDAGAMGGRGRGGRGGSGAAPSVTADAGHNRFVWNGMHSNGMFAPPGAYHVRLTVGNRTFTQPFNMVIDPRLEAEGISAADLREQFDHNTRMRAMVEEVNALVQRVRNEQTRLEGGAGQDAQRKRQVDAFVDQLVAGPVRYSAPGLRDHIQYLAGMTSRSDQKVGNQATERYAVLRSELDRIKAEVDRLLGPGG
jgi:hypothetical protein